MRLSVVVLVLLACASSALAAPSALQKECDAARRKKPPAAADTKLAVRVTKSSDPIRSVVVRRHVQCGYRNKKFLRALESVSMEVLTQDRGDVQFDTKNPAQGKSYFVECYIGLPSRAKLVKAFKTPIGVSCVHRIARLDGAEHDRVTGVHSFKNGPGTLEVVDVKGGAWTLRFSGTAENQFEVVRLDAEATGAITNSVQTFECESDRKSKRPTPEPCG